MFGVRFRPLRSFLRFAAPCGLVCFMACAGSQEPERSAQSGRESSRDASSEERMVFEDEFVRFELPAGWHASGGDGEYQLESDADDMGSLLLLAFDVEALLDERLANIEEQFLSTELSELEESETRIRSGEEIVYQRYRLMMADPEGKDSNSVLLHQYVFWRSDIQVLLQLEMIPGREAAERVFETFYENLVVTRSPDEVESSGN